MNSNGGSAGESTVFYATGTTSITGEELEVALLANSAVAPTPPLPPAPPTAPADVIAVNTPPSPGGIQVSWTASLSYVTPTYTIVASPGDITKTLIPGTIPETSIKFNVSVDGIVLGTEYTFVVTAENDLGTSPPSAPSVPIKAITYADPPSGISAIDGQDGQTTVSWIASIYDGESPIISYTVFSYSEDDPTVYTDSVPPSSSSAVLTGLINGFQYIFYVSVKNGFGENPSVGGPSSEITPLGPPPTAPLNVSATAGLGNAVVTWDAPTNDGGVPISSYTITSSPPDFAVILTMPFSPLSIIATPLTNGTSYTFTVFATNTKGDSPLSDPSAAVMPVGAPDPPTNVVATPGNASADVTWDSPQSSGGSAITSYTVTSNPGNISITTPQLSATFSTLVNGTQYTFTVFATNAIGDSIESTPSSPVTPATVPNAPLNAFAIAGNGEAQVLWDFPAFDGGSPIINFTVTSIPATVSGPQTTPDDSTTLIFLGLTNGTPYTCTVYATNLIGNSPASALTTPVTPAGVTAPGPPQTVSASLDAPGKILVSWSAPVSDGGSSVLSYKIYADPPDVAAQSVSSAFTTVDFDNTLTNGTLYTFTVTATNAIGESLPSAGATATPVTLPSDVQSVIIIPRNQGAIVTWAQPLSDGGSQISNYRVNYKVSTDSVFTTINLGPSNFSYEITGLVNLTLYDFFVGADNAFYSGGGGITAQSTPGPTIADPPNIISVQAGPGTGEVTIEFAPNIYDGGGVFQNYLVQDVGATFAAAPSSSPAVLAGLLTGATYQFTVKTVTTIGTSFASAPSSSVTV
jgi:titin